MRKLIVSLTAVSGIALIAAATSSQFSLPQASAGQNELANSSSFDRFENPIAMKALYEGDVTTLKATKSNLFYVMGIIETLHAHDAWYFMGQEAVLLLDPRLPLESNKLMLTRRDALGSALEIGSRSLKSALEGFADARRQAERRDELDPLGEMNSLFSGLLQGQMVIAGLKADASKDARHLMILASRDPETFERFYATIRSYIYSF